MDQLLAIRAFARIVEAGTFTKAADSLGMPNATLTKLVQSLEAHLRVKLLQRTTRRVSVTPEGAAYYEKTMQLLRELEAIDSSFSAAQVRPRGQLRIDMGSSIANLVVIPVLPEFFQRYPDIRVDMSVSDSMVDLVGDNVDCVIRGGALTDMAMIGRQIGSATWVTSAAPAYLERHGVPTHPAQLEQDHVLVNYLAARTGRASPMRFVRGSEKVEVAGRRSIGVNESNAHIAAGLAGLGVVQTFAYVARPHLESGSLVAILPEWQPPPYPFFVVYPPNRHVSNRLRVFIDWIAERFPGLM